MRFSAGDIVGAPVSTEEKDYHYDYTDPAGKLPDTVKLEGFYGLVFVLSALTIFLRLYISIFGRRMRNEGLRWHSIYMSVLNAFHIVFYANAATDSPWYDYMRNVYVIKHYLALEQWTLTAFPSSLSFLIPLYLVTYVFPSLRRTFFFKWFIWTVVYVGLTVVSLYFIFNYKESLDGTGKIPYDPLIGYYHFVMCYVSLFWTLILIFFLAFGCLCLCGYAVNSLGSPNRRDNMDKKTKDNSALLMLACYVLLPSVFYLPKSMLNMANFYVAHVVPILQRYQGPVKISDANPAQTLRNLSKYADMITTVLYYVPIGELLFPLAEFIASSVFLQMYRESLLNLLSCGVFYHGDSNGSIWRLLPRSQNAVHPYQPNPFKSPGEVEKATNKAPPISTVTAKLAPVSVPVVNENNAVTNGNAVANENNTNGGSP